MARGVSPRRAAARLPIAAAAALAALLAAAAASGAGARVVFSGASVKANAAAGGVSITATVRCSNARRFSAHVWLASKEGSNQTFFDKTLTGPVTGGKGSGSVVFRGTVPVSGFIVAGSNVYCWDTDKSMGVGYRSLFVAYCSARGSCQATTGKP